jgi:hypothetical protein
MVASDRAGETADASGGLQGPVISHNRSFAIAELRSDGIRGPRNP